MSGLPPGITEHMIPGSGVYQPAYGYVLEDWHEIEPAEWETWGCSEGDSTCHRCGDLVGFYLARSDRLPDVDKDAWSECWETPDELIWCADCKETAGVATVIEQHNNGGQA